MGNFEAFSQDSSEIKEIDWVQQQVKTELQNLQKESFYTTWEDGKVNYDMDAVKNYLTTIQQKNRSDLTSKNSSAWIMAVQIVLEKRGIDVGKVDGIFGAGTKAAVRTFQEENEITADGLPGPQTIAKLLEWEDKKPEWGNWKEEWGNWKEEWGNWKEEWEDKKPEWGNWKEEWGNWKEEWGNWKEEWGNWKEEWGNWKEEWGNWEEEWGNWKEEWGNWKEEWGNWKEESVTETPEKMDLTKVNIDELKKVYGETIDKNWKGFQEKRNVIEIWGLKFKKWTEGMTGLGYKVEDDWSIMWFGQYVDGALTGKWVYLPWYWHTYQWDFVEWIRDWKGKGSRGDWATYEWGRKQGRFDGRGVGTWPGWTKFEGHRERGKHKWRETATYPNGDKRSINHENNDKWKWDYIFSTGEKIYGEWKRVDDGRRREWTRMMPDGKELKINMNITDYNKYGIIEATSSENTIKIKVEKDYFVFQPESPRLAFPRGRKFDPFAIAHALNWAIKHVKDTQQKGTYKFDQFESSFSWDFVQVDREWAALDSDLIDTRKYPGMNATKVSDWLNANAEAFGLLNAKK